MEGWTSPFKKFIPYENGLNFIIVKVKLCNINTLVCNYPRQSYCKYLSINNYCDLSYKYLLRDRKQLFRYQLDLRFRLSGFIFFLMASLLSIWISLHYITVLPGPILLAGHLIDNGRLDKSI